jgi:hypothetical protein
MNLGNVSCAWPSRFYCHVPWLCSSNVHVLVGHPESTVTLFHCEARFKDPPLKEHQGTQSPHNSRCRDGPLFSVFLFCFVFPFSHVRPTTQKYDQKRTKVVLRVKKIGGGARSTRILLGSQKDIIYISQSSQHSFVFFPFFSWFVKHFFSFYFSLFD